MRQVTLATLIFGVMFSGAIAQTTPPLNDPKPAGQETNRAECQGNFKRADADGDGTVSAAEAEAAKSLMPTQLGMPGPITESEFMKACESRLPKGG